jgi:2-succinyl-6-hydroxy-2,4-cyclohexadiene-1-carboxylate synthase
MGGRLALYFAVTHPGRVASLALESASPGLAGRRERQERRAQDDQRTAEIRSAGLDPFIDRWYQQPLFHSLQKNPEKLAALKAQRKRNNPEMMARLVAELSPGRQPSLWKKLAAIQAPVLLLTGAQDEKYTAMVARMARLIQQSKVIIAPRAGHNVHLEEPAWFERGLRDHLENTLAAGLKRGDP